MVDSKSLIMALKFFKNSGLKAVPDFNDPDNFAILKELWLEAFSDITPEVFVRSCKMIAVDNIFFPALSEVRKKCLEVTNGKAKKGIEVWEDIRAIMLRVTGKYSDANERAMEISKFETEAIKEAARKFDWDGYGQDKETNRSIHRAHFSKLYEGIAERLTFNKENDRLEEIAAPDQKLAGLIGNIGKEIN